MDLSHACHCCLGLPVELLQFLRHHPCASVACLRCSRSCLNCCRYFVLVAAFSTSAFFLSCLYAVFVDVHLPFWSWLCCCGTLYSASSSSRHCRSCCRCRCGCRVCSTSISYSSLLFIFPSLSSVGPEFDVQAQLDSDIFHPSFNVRVEHRDAALPPSAILLIKVSSRILQSITRFVPSLATSVCKTPLLDH